MDLNCTLRKRDSRSSDAGGLIADTAKEGNRARRWKFVVFAYSGGKTRKNKRIVLLRRTSGMRMSRTLAAIKLQLRLRRHDLFGETGRWLASVIRGWLGYHAVPDNYNRLDAFVTEATKLWLHQLRRRSQKGRAAWPFGANAMIG